MLNTSLIYKNKPEFIQQTEIVVDTQSKATPFRCFGFKPEIDENEDKGETLTFRFVSSSKYEDGVILPFNVQQDQLTTALKLAYPYGIILLSKEKTAVYPVIQFCYGNYELNNKDEAYLGQGYISQNCLYKEVRQIQLEYHDSLDYRFNRYYIILGFKTSQSHALLDSWKDWTGVRYIYINFPQQLSLKKITLYRKETIRNDGINLFPYIVVVMCDGVDSKDKQTILLDFVQRLRAERTSHFISVYYETIK